MGDGADSNTLRWSGPEHQYHERRVRWLYRLAYTCDKYYILLDIDKRPYHAGNLTKKLFIYMLSRMGPYERLNQTKLYLG